MTKDLSVTAKFELVGETTVNLLKDGNFPSSAVIADDGASWKLGQGENWGNSAATATVSAGAATIDVTTIGEATYQPQLVQYGLGLDSGMSYKLTFKAKAASARKIEASFQQASDPWATYASKEFDLTTSEEEYSFVFKMDSATDLSSQFAFNIGQATGEVSISDVKLVYTTAGATSISRGPGVATRGAQLAFVSGKTLYVSPIDGSRLQVRVVDVNGTVRANFQAANAGSFSLSAIPSGRYFLDVAGVGVKQTTSIVLQ